MFAPVMPSTAAWWYLEITATLSPSTPSTTLICHSGLLRSIGVLAMSPTSSASSLRPPGRGNP
ncbi:Uncharacterised protein [Mycobacteroides abscessus subsp. abscessus]|nr:Uncharacterised protein [Mycobacteroides abscessus subsp. abscessus]